MKMYMNFQLDYKCVVTIGLYVPTKLTLNFTL